MASFSGAPALFSAGLAERGQLISHVPRRPIAAEELRMARRLLVTQWAWKTGEGRRAGLLIGGFGGFFTSSHEHPGWDGGGSVGWGEDGGSYWFHLLLWF